MYSVPCRGLNPALMFYLLLERLGLLNTFYIQYFFNFFLPNDSEDAVYHLPQREYPRNCINFSGNEWSNQPRQIPELINLFELSPSDGEHRVHFTLSPGPCNLAVPMRWTCDGHT